MSIPNTKEQLTAKTIGLGAKHLLLFFNSQNELMILNGSEERLISLQGLIEYKNITLPTRKQVEELNKYHITYDKGFKFFGHFYIFDIVPEVCVRQVLQKDDTTYNITSSSLINLIDYMKSTNQPLELLSITQEENNFLDKEVGEYERLYDSSTLFNAQSDIEELCAPIINSNKTLVWVWSKELDQKSPSKAPIDLGTDFNNIVGGAVRNIYDNHSWKLKLTPDTNYISQSWYTATKLIDILDIDASEIDIEKQTPILRSIIAESISKDSGVAIRISYRQYKELGKQFWLPRVFKTGKKIKCAYTVIVGNVLLFKISRDTIFSGALGCSVEVMYTHLNKDTGKLEVKGLHRPNFIDQNGNLKEVKRDRSQIDTVLEGYIANDYSYTPEDSEQISIGCAQYLEQVHRYYEKIIDEVAEFIGEAKV